MSSLPDKYFHRCGTTHITYKVHYAIKPLDVCERRTPITKPIGERTAFTRLVDTVSEFSTSIIVSMLYWFPSNTRYMHCHERWFSSVNELMYLKSLIFF